MRKIISTFQKLINNQKISISPSNLNKFIKQFTHCLIQNNIDNLDEIKKCKNESKLIIIDKVSELDPYFMVIIDQTIIFMTNISLLPKFLNNFEKSTIFTLSHKVNSYLPVYFQKQILKFKDTEKSIKLFSENFKSIQVGYKEIDLIWKLILPSFSLYFLNKSYQKLLNNQTDIKHKIFKEEDFIKLQNLGVGSSSTVTLAFHIKTEELVAIKVFNNSTSFDREYKFYQKIHHQSIPHFYGRIKNKEILIIEYIRGKTLDEIKCDQLSDEDRFFIIIQLMIVFEYFQYHEIVYRDLKPNNLIVNENKKIILIDFDQVINLNENDGNKIATSGFSTVYASPDTKYSSKMDVFSIGILIYFIFFNEEPVYRRIEKSNENTFLFHLFSEQYLSVKKMCEECTETDSSKRPPITKLIDFFFNYFYERNSECKSIESIGSINECILYPLWIQNEYQFKSFFLMKFSNINNSTKIVENYLEEANTIHLFSQFDSYYLHYPERYFKSNIKKFNYLFGLTNLEDLDPIQINRFLIDYNMYTSGLNDLQAQYCLGIFYYEGTIIKQDINKAIQYLKLAADQNHPDAQYYLGIIYLDGKCIEQNINKSIKYLTLAANQNHLNALYLLGIVYLEGKYIEQNINKAIYYLELAANQNDLDAQLYLANTYFDGIFFKSDINKTIHYLTLAANQNDPISQSILGELYFEGKYITRNLNKAIYYFTRAADQNNLDSQIFLGIIYSNDKYKTLDINKSIYYLTLAANQNNSIALYYLGVIYFEGKYIARNINKSINYFTLAANQNDLDAQFYLATIYFCGEYLKRDINKAIHYFTLAANQNDDNAQNYLGIIYYNGKYIKRDIDKAIYYFTLAANQNNPAAQNNLGTIYSEGKYIKQDIKKAIHYFILASNQNYPKTQFNLGTFYYEGKYIKQDIHKAILYLSLASNQNNLDAQNYLGIIYSENKYIKRDINKAIHYFKLASNQNNKDAQYFLGFCYINGIHLSKNINKGSYYLYLAAEQNNNEAQFLLGVVYSKGENIEKDMKKSIFYYKNASSMNNSKAKNNLAMIYLHGIGVNENKPYAIELLKEAVRLNDPVSMYNLAHIYFYDEIESNETIIDLLLKSIIHFTNSIRFLGIVLIKIHKIVTRETVENTVKDKINIDHNLLNKLIDYIFMFIELNKQKNSNCCQYLYDDSMYDWDSNAIESCSLTKKEKKDIDIIKKSKDIDEMFYEGFGISI